LLGSGTVRKMWFSVLQFDFWAIELLSFGIEVKALRGYGLGVRGEELGVKRQGSSVRI